MSTSELVIRALSPALTIFSVPFARFGVVPVGGRSTAVKLKNDEVFVLVSSPCDEPTKKAISEMGTVKYLLTPDIVHAMYISAFHEAYPEAKCIGPEGIAEKKPDVRWTGVMGQGGEDITYGFEEEIKLHFFSGHQNKEIATFHVPSRTLIEADLLFNLPPTEQYSNTNQSPNMIWPLSLIHHGLKPGGAGHDQLSGMVGKDKAAMIRDCKVVNGWDFDRIIPCHGDVIETGGKKAFQDVMKRYLSE